MSNTIAKSVNGESLHMQQLLMAVIVHDIKTPLRYFMWTAKSLQEDLERAGLPDTLSERAQLLHSSAERMHIMVEDLLQYARVELRSDAHSRIRKVNVHVAVAAKIALFHHIAQAKGINITNTVDPELTLYTDSDCLAVILHNVLDNALKFTSGGCIQVSCSQNEHSARLEIADTGRGMSREYMDWCNNERSCPGSHLPSDDFIPTGLGLLLVRELLGRIRGRLIVSRGEHGGTVIVLELSSL